MIVDCEANQQSTIINLQFFNGVVAKWQGKGLQNPDQGFKSPRRLCIKRAAKSLLVLC
jgi:hypothetical protein